MGNLGRHTSKDRVGTAMTLVLPDQNRVKHRSIVDRMDSLHRENKLEPFQFNDSRRSVKRNSSDSDEREDSYNMCTGFLLVVLRWPMCCRSRSVLLDGSVIQ